MAEFVSVGKVGEVPPGQVRQLELGGGTQVCLANVHGTFYAIGGECTHQGGPLGEGVNWTERSSPAPGTGVSLMSRQVP